MGDPEPFKVNDSKSQVLNYDNEVFIRESNVNMRWSTQDLLLYYSAYNSIKYWRK